MGLEIERKFLVIDDSYRAEARSKKEIEQGYLSAEPDRTVRVRVVDNEGWLTVKSRNRGCVRGEWEYRIPVAEAREMLLLAVRRLCKTRYYVGRWEIDEFHGAQEGLRLAEIELNAPDEAIDLPAFVGKEVTGDARYYNSVIASRGE